MNVLSFLENLGVLPKAKKNLAAWREVISSPKLRKEYIEEVADPIAQKAIFPYGFYKQAPQLGQLLQRTKVPGAGISEKYPQLAAAFPGLQVPGLAQSMAQSYGRTLERISTPKGRNEIFESAKKVATEKPTWKTFQEPAVEAAFDLPDFLPGGFLFGSIVKEAGEKTAREFAEKAAKELGEKATRETGEKATKYAFNINKPKLGLAGEAAQKLDDVVDTMRPILETHKGGPLTNKQIIEGGRKGLMLDQVMDRKEAAEFSSKLQASRNYLKTMSESKGVTKEFLDQLEVVSSTAADSSRKLRAFAVGAEDATIKASVLADLQKLGVDAEELLTAAKGIDWNNADMVTWFYRKFKPASFIQKIDEFRYVNMLSSPNTHAVNTFSNFLQTAVVTPVEKTLTGGLDWIRSKVTGSEQKYFASQGVDYTKGYWRNLPEAWGSFKKTLSGKSAITRPDLKFIPTGTGKLQKAYTTPLRLLEASDQFFRTLVESGEREALERAGITGAKATKVAKESAEYRLFRQSFDPSGKLGQNKVLQIWDKWNSAVANLRRAPGGKWICPFLVTPTNILKMGVEYSPLGITTVKGAREPMQQLAKTMIGTGVFMGAYSMADAGLSTWDAPTNAKEKEAFYAAGLQKYSLKIGDRWVSYSKLGPLSYPIAMAAAMKWAEENGAEKSKLEIAGKGLVGVMRFFADQSYVRGLGDIIDAARGDEFKLKRAFANIPSQLVPYRALQGWVARLVDPIYRKAKTPIESMMTQVPGLSKQLDPYTTPEGKPSVRQSPWLNAFSPVQSSKEEPEGMGYYQTYQELKGLKAEATKRTETEQETATGIWSEIKDLDRSEQLQRINQLKQEGTLTQSIYTRLKKMKTAEEKGMTAAEKSIYMLGPIEEAKWHWEKIKGWDREKQLKYLNDLKARGLLTQPTYEELKKLRGAK